MIIVYTKNSCPYCIKAKNLLKKCNLSYKEINLSLEPDMIDEMLKKSNGMKTVPQIFINTNHIGGFDQLLKLYEKTGLEQF